jgi:tetratricopeptide (TPR) repeat protein
LPFALDEDEWESELAAWDAHLPALLGTDRTDGSAVAGEEDLFRQAPTTVVSDVSALLSEREASQTAEGEYASMVALDQDADSLFREPPPPEPEPSLVPEPLPEMAADAWRGDLRRLVDARDVPAPPAPDSAYWLRWGRLLTDELSIADTTGHQVDLTLGAARVAEHGGDGGEALRLYDDALTLQPQEAAALRGRARILESQGRWDGAIEALGKLAAATGGEERNLYQATMAEWRLGRGLVRNVAELDAIPVGASRAFAEAEVALRRGDHAGVASAFESAAHAIGGRAGSVILAAAARFSEAGGDGASAAAERFVASRLGNGLSVALGRLRDAARVDQDGAAEALGDVLRVVPSGGLRTSVARWAAALAWRRGDGHRAGQILNDPSLQGTPALIRDQLDWMSDGSVTPDDGLFARAEAIWPTAEAAACLSLRRARCLSRRGEVGDAVTVLQHGLGQAPDAVPLALAAEALGRQATDSPTRVAAYRLWGSHDPARSAAAALAVADAQDETAVGGDERARTAFRAAALAAPGSATFWRLAARELHARSFVSAAEALEAGAAAWSRSALAPALQERAHELRRAAAPSGTSASPEGRPSAKDIAEVLAATPDDPTALALYTIDNAASPEALSSAFWKAGGALGRDGGGQFYQLQAITCLDAAGEPFKALALAIELEATSPGWSPARGLVRRLSRTVADGTDRALIKARLKFDRDDPATALAAAEALEDLHQPQAAAAIFEDLADGPLDADAQRGLVRTRAPEPIADDVTAWLGELPATPPGLMAAADAADTVRRDGSDKQFAAAIEALAAAVARGHEPAAGRSAAALLAQAASVERGHSVDVAERRLRAALEHDATNLSALRSLRRLLIARGATTEAIALCEREAACESVPEHQVATLLLAADLALGGDGPDKPRAAELLQKVLVVQPEHQEVFERLRDLLEKAGDHRRLSDLFAARIAVAANPFEVTAMRLGRAELLAGPLGDRAAAEAELSAILAKEPQHARALTRLSQLYYESGAFGQAAELYINRARTERSPERLREIFLRLGRIYTRHAADPKRAIGAYARVLQLEADNREALEALSELYAAQGELKNAMATTQRLVDVESDSERRAAYLVHLGRLWEKSGDLRQAGARFRRAVDEAPKNGPAIAEMARYLQRTHDVAGHRALVDQSLLVLRRDFEAGRLDVSWLRTAAALLQSRGTTRAAAAAAQLVAALSSEAGDQQAVATWAAPPAEGRRLHALARPEIDDRTFPAGAPPAIRNIFRLLGETLSKGAPDIKAYDVARGDRVSRGHPPRDVIDAIGAELGAPAFELYVKPARHLSDVAPVVVVPGEPAAVILGAQILNLGPSALRFAAARAMRLLATRLDLVMAAPAADTGAKIGAQIGAKIGAQIGAQIGGLIRLYVPDFRHPDLPEREVNGHAAHLARVLPRNLRQEVMPFALEIAAAGTFSPSGLVAAVRDGANAVGLLASGDLPACLSVVVAAADSGSGSGAELSLGVLAANAEALALLNFALSDGYDDLCRAVE